ncbi:MAG TPA: (2Fe-2S)-binding protein [Burkholderiaceae bacterium]|nr:(2Fe-2S)-binding protein [Burkholderiaceae bacterium]
MFICVCNAITERQVQEAVASGAQSLSDLEAQLGVGGCCGCCRDTASDYLPGGQYAGCVTETQDEGAFEFDAANDSTLLPLQAVAVNRA